MFDLPTLLRQAAEMNASDLHITVGAPPVVRVPGGLKPLLEQVLNYQDTEDMVQDITTSAQWEKLVNLGELDFAYGLSGVGRFRVNAFRQRGTYSLAVRLIPARIFAFEELGLPEVVRNFSHKHQGLLLVTGATGSGKSTTLAAIVNEINQNESKHIVTIEDPIEYLHRHGKCLVNQREVGADTLSFAAALRAALREDPDVILVGEMRDLETIGIAVSAAETGHLVLATLHTTGAAASVDRIVDVFPPYQQQQIRIQLSSVLLGVVSQQLLVRADRLGRIAAVEVMVATPAIKNLIREGKTHQIMSTIQTGARFGMQSMDASLKDLVRRQLITPQLAREHALEPDQMSMM